jgi:arginine deiminase
MSDETRSPALRVLGTPAVEPCVASEVARLRRVLVHRPGQEFQALSDYARTEHDALCAALAARDVEVPYLDELLGDVLRQQSLRRHVIETKRPGSPPP